MKLFRIIFLVIGIAFFSFSAMAQSPLAFSVEAGWNLSKPTDTDKAKSGFNIGASVEYGFAGNWFVDGGLRLTSKPWEINYEGYNGLTLKATPYYLNIPVKVGYRYGVSECVALTLSAGPYVGCGLWGKGKESLSTGGDIDNIFDDYMKRFEVGGIVRIGAELMRHYIISAEYSLQFNDFDKGNEGPGACRNQVFSVNLGYRF